MSNKTKIIIIVAIVVLILAAVAVSQIKKKKQQEELELERKNLIRYFTGNYNLGALWYYSQDPQGYNEFVNLLPQLQLPEFDQAASADYFESKSNLDTAKWAFRHYTSQAMNYKVTISEQIINEANYSLRDKMTEKQQAALIIENTISITPTGLPFQ